MKGLKFELTSTKSDILVTCVIKCFVKQPEVLALILANCECVLVIKVFRLNW